MFCEQAEKYHEIWIGTIGPEVDWPYCVVAGSYSVYTIHFGRRKEYTVDRTIPSTRHANSQVHVEGVARHPDASVVRTETGLAGLYVYLRLQLKSF